MAWFFCENVSVPIHIIVGEDAVHIIKSLRMTAGEELTVCDKDKIQHDCVIESISNGEVTVRVTNSYPCKNEPDTFVTLYQALPKSDKMDYIIQKAVELGVSEIVPVLTARCVSRPDEKSMKKKLDRWNKIALQAAMQSRRGYIPKVLPALKLSDAAKRASDSTAVICYELGGVPLGEIVNSQSKYISLFIGSEGGFEQSEVDTVIQNNGTAATLGNRILRAETAPIAALSVIMYLSGNLGNEKTEIDPDAETHGGNWKY